MITETFDLSIRRPLYDTAHQTEVLHGKILLRAELKKANITQKRRL